MLQRSSILCSDIIRLFMAFRLFGISIRGRAFDRPRGAACTCSTLLYNIHYGSRTWEEGGSGYDTGSEHAAACAAARTWWGDILCTCAAGATCCLACCFHPLQTCWPAWRMLLGRKIRSDGAQPGRYMTIGNDGYAVVLRLHFLPSAALYCRACYPFSRLCSQCFLITHVYSPYLWMVQPGWMKHALLWRWLRGGLSSSGLLAGEATYGLA